MWSKTQPQSRNIHSGTLTLLRGVERCWFPSSVTIPLLLLPISEQKKTTQFRVWKAGSTSQVEFSSRSSRTENWPFLTNWPRGCGTPSDIDPILTRKRPSKAVVECATLSFKLSIKALRGMWRSDGTVHLWNNRTAHPTTFLLADFSEMRGRFLFFPFLANSNRRHSPWRGYYAIQCQTYYMQTFPWFSPF